MWRAISGAKNAALPILCAGLLTPDAVALSNVPRLQDVATMLKLLRQMGLRVEQDGENVTLNGDAIDKLEAPYELVKTMRAAIRNERAVELAFEEHRFWDVRRWKIAGEEGVMKGNMYGLRLRQISGSSDFHFEQVVFEQRVWEDKMYLYPFPNTEIYKQYLVQNPGW